ncbi:hypothetical protein BJX96DRAFT_153796 [Aspergillus floccosus]
MCCPVVLSVCDHHIKPGPKLHRSSRALQILLPPPNSPRRPVITLRDEDSFHRVVSSISKRPKLGEAYSIKVSTLMSCVLEFFLFFFPFFSP